MNSSRTKQYSRRKRCCVQFRGWQCRSTATRFTTVEGAKCWLCPEHYSDLAALQPAVIKQQVVILATA